MTPRIHPVRYYQSPRDSTRPLRLVQTRDDLAALELLPALVPGRYAYGEPLLMRPPTGRRGRPRSVDLSLLRAGDRLLMNSRPPLDDDDWGEPRRVPRARNNLEELIFAAVRPYFRRITRSQTRIADDLRRTLPPGFETRAFITYQSRNGPWYSAVNALDGQGFRKPEASRYVTAAFLLHLPKIGPGLPGLLLAFGMDGLATLAWCSILARREAHLLDHEGFVMAELEAREVPDDATDLRFARDWKVEVVLRHPPLQRRAP